VASSSTFQITITALDQASATLRALKKNLAQTLDNEPVVKLGHSLSDLAHETGLPAIAHHAASALGKVARLGAGLVSFLLGPLKSIAGLLPEFSIAGLVEVEKSAAESAAALYEASEKTGVQIGALAKLHYAAKQSGTSTEQLDKALERLNRTVSAIYQAPGKGAGKEFARLFETQHIKIWTDKAHKLVRPTADIFGDLAEAVKRNKDNRPILEQLAKAMGTRGGDELIPMLMQGKDALQQFGDEFIRLHGPFTEATGLAGKQAVEAWRRLDAATSGLRDSIGYALAPAITSIITPLTEWIAKNRELISGKIAEWAKDAATWLRNLDWKEIGKDALEFMHDMKIAFQGLADVFEGVKAVIGWIQRNWPTIKFTLDALGVPVPDMPRAGKSRFQVAMDWIAGPKKPPAPKITDPSKRLPWLDEFGDWLAGPKNPTTPKASALMRTPAPAAQSAAYPAPAGSPDRATLPATPKAPAPAIHPPLADQVGFNALMRWLAGPKHEAATKSSTVARASGIPIVRIVPIAHPAPRQTDARSPSVHAVAPVMRVEMRKPIISRAQSAPPPPPPKGKLDVSVQLSGLPRGTQTAVKTQGDVVGQLDVGRRFVNT
jgi:hypothetical protein